MGKQSLFEKRLEECVEKAKEEPNETAEEVELKACIIHETRREMALESLENATQSLGKIAEETPGIVREPMLDIIDDIDDVGKDLKELEISE